MRGEGGVQVLAGAVEAGPPSKSESLGLEVTCCWGRFCLRRQLTLQMCVACLLTRFFFRHQLLRHLGSARRLETKSGFEHKHSPSRAPGRPQESSSRPWTCQLIRGEKRPPMPLAHAPGGAHPLETSSCPSSTPQAGCTHWFFPTVSPWGR